MIIWATFKFLSWLVVEIETSQMVIIGIGNAALSPKPCKSS